MSKWISINEKLPLSGWKDSRYRAPFHEDEFKVLINGVESTAVFWACWAGDDRNAEAEDEFIMEFDEEGVTHWFCESLEGVNFGGNK